MTHVWRNGAAERWTGLRRQHRAVATVTSGELVNFTAVGSDAGVPPRTVREWYQVLEDTLVGHLLPPYRGTRRRKPVATSRFYLFDVGVGNLLAGRGEVIAGSEAYGRALEHLVRFRDLLTLSALQGS